MRWVTFAPMCEQVVPSVIRSVAEFTGISVLSMCRFHMSLIVPLTTVPFAGKLNVATIVTTPVVWTIGIQVVRQQSTPLGAIGRVWAKS